MKLYLFLLMTLSDQLGAWSNSPPRDICPNPAMFYIGSLEKCRNITFSCPSGQISWADNCGCGCLSPCFGYTPGANVKHYVSGSDCKVPYEKCRYPYQSFKDSCGCGCIKNCNSFHLTPSHVSDYNRDLSFCEWKGPKCAPDEDAFYDECGCGCRKKEDKRKKCVSEYLKDLAQCALADSIQSLTCSGVAFRTCIQEIERDNNGCKEAARTKFELCLNP